MKADEVEPRSVRQLIELLIIAKHWSGHKADYKFRIILLNRMYSSYSQIPLLEFGWVIGQFHFLWITLFRQKPHFQNGPQKK